MSATYDVGDSVLLTFTVRDADGVLTAATVALTMTDPAGTTSLPTVTTPSTGVYKATVAPSVAGMWLYRWVATGAITTAEDGQFVVEPNQTADLYATVPELRDQFGDSSNLLDQDRLELCLRAASRQIDHYCGRRFWRDPAVTTRTYRPDDFYGAWVDDISTSTGLIVATDSNGDGTWATTWATTDYQLEPFGADSVPAFAWTRIAAIDRYTFPSSSRRPSLRVTARFGWSMVPDEIRLACLLKAARLLQRKDSPLGIQGFGDFGPVRVSRFEDPDVAMLLGPFVRYSLAGV